MNFQIIIETGLIELNNDFKASIGKTIKVKGLKYDASNLTKLLEQNDDNFLRSRRYASTVLFDRAFSSTR